MHTTTDQRNEPDHSFKPCNTRFHKGYMAGLVLGIAFYNTFNRLQTKAPTSATFKMSNHYRMFGLKKKGDKKKDEKGKKAMRDQECSEDEAKVLQKRWEALWMALAMQRPDSDRYYLTYQPDLRTMADRGARCLEGIQLEGLDVDLLLDVLPVHIALFS